MIAFIGLGSNLEHPEQQILRALQSLNNLPETVLLKKSSLYQSTALTLPGSSPQDDYVNAVASLDTRLSAEQLLTQLQAIENAQGRIRTAKWGARTLDLDILLYGDETVASENLTIPHAQLKFRNFVIHPLFEIAGDIYIPGLDSLARLAEQTDWTGLYKIQAN